MGEPITLPNGLQITGWDQNVIDVQGPGGRQRIARAGAPADLEGYVAAAEYAASASQPSAESPGSHEPMPMAEDPMARLRSQGPAAPMGSMQPGAPALPQTPEPAPIVGATGGPMSAVNAEIARLRSMPQVRMGGGGTRTATSVTRMPAAAAAEVREMQTPIDESVAEQQIAIEEQAGVEERGLGEVSKLHAEQGQRIERELQDQESLRGNYEQRFATEQQKLAELNQRAQTEIDPKKFWKDRSTGERILAAVSMAIGAFVNARSEGRVANAPMQIIQQAIDRDIDAQLENRNRAERDVSRQAGVIGLLGDKYSDDLQKRQAALVLANEAVAKQIDGIAAGISSEQAKAKAMQLSAQLRQSAAERAQAFTAQVAGSETVQTQQVPGGAVATGAKRQADALSAMAYGEGGTFDHETYVPGAFIATGEHRAANSKTDAVEINKQAATVTQMLRKADQIEQAAKNGGKLSPQKRAEVAALYASLTLDVKNAESAGALDAGTQQITADILGPKPTDLTSVANTIPLFKQTVRAKHLAAIQNRTHPIDPTTIPLAAKQRAGGTGIQTQAPATRPLAVEDEP
jgi:hypothetical protein